LFFANLGCGEFCESMYAYNSSMHQKCSNYALTNLLIGLCKFIWIIDPLVTHVSPHPKAPACPSTPKVLRAKKLTPIPYPSIIFTFGFAMESTKEFRGALARGWNNFLPWKGFIFYFFGSCGLCVFKLFFDLPFLFLLWWFRLSIVYWFFFRISNCLELWYRSYWLLNHFFNEN
jgi:hypothetical protein